MKIGLRGNIKATKLKLDMGGKERFGDSKRGSGVAEGVVDEVMEVMEQKRNKPEGKGFYSGG